MTNMCICCETRPTRNHNVLCHKCGLEERAKLQDNTYIRSSRIFKMDTREVMRDLPSLYTTQRQRVGA